VTKICDRLSCTRAEITVELQLRKVLEIVQKVVN
jgi:hypothetical protein